MDHLHDPNYIKALYTCCKGSQSSAMHVNGKKLDKIMKECFSAYIILRASCLKRSQISAKQKYFNQLNSQVVNICKQVFWYKGVASFQIVAYVMKTKQQKLVVLFLLL